MHFASATPHVKRNYNTCTHIGVDLSPWLGDVAGGVGRRKSPSGMQGQSPGIGGLGGELVEVPHKLELKLLCQYKSKICVGEIKCNEINK